MKNKITWIIAALSLIITAVAINFMPDKVPMHYNFAGEVDRYGSKFEMMIFPGITLLFAIFWAVLTRAFDRKIKSGAEEKEIAEIKANSKVIYIASIATMVFFLITQLVFIYNVFKNGNESNEESPFDFMTIEMAILGVLMIIMGNVMPKSKRNGMFGLRTPWSMANDRTWLACNRFGGVLACVAGFMILLVALLLDGMMIIWVTLGIIVVMSITVIVYSYVAYKKWGRE